jgi:hypothetical protein
MSSALTGGYAFRFDGVSYDELSQSLFPMSVAGRFTADAEQMTAGIEDINNGGSVLQNVDFTGTYTVASTGRGTGTMPDTPSGFSFYVVSEKKLIFVSLDYNEAFLGIAEQQTLPSFSSGSLTGDYVFASTGYSTLGLVDSAGQLTADGISAISSGVSDNNDNGTVTENVFNGMYSVSSNGRGELTITADSDTSNFAFYMVSPDSAFFVGTDSTSVVSGEVFGQDGGPFSAASLAGSYGFGLAGLVLVPPDSYDIHVSGQFLADGVVNLVGTNDINDFTSPAPEPDEPLTGPYTVSPNGRGTMTVTTGGVTSNQRFYLISPSRFVVIGVDSSEVLTGGGEKQF